MPEIKLPRRSEKPDKGEKKQQSKTGDNDLTITLNAIYGTLRHSGEKHMLLEAGDKGVLRFRLLAKTQFLSKDGEAVRDSLLKPGDQLKVSVNADDEETALRVVLLRAGTPAERASAEKPVDVATIKTPEGLTAGDGVAAKKDGDEERRPKIQRKQVIPEQSPQQTGVYEGKTVSGDDSLLFDKSDEIIEAAREANAEFGGILPNFLVNQLTTRYISKSRPAEWRALDLISAEVACVDGVEEYRKVSVNGRSSKDPVEKTGSWSTGEFVTVLTDVLSPTTAAVFVKRGQDRIARRAAHLYDYTVQQPNSHWTIHATTPQTSMAKPDTRATYRPAYRGSLWIDTETHRVLRVELRALSMPEDFPYDKVEMVLDYDAVRIGDAKLLLPVHSENLMCVRDSHVCTRNSIDFRNYRKFTAESTVEFDTKLIAAPNR